MRKITRIICLAIAILMSISLFGCRLIPEKKTWNSGESFEVFNQENVTMSLEKITDAHNRKTLTVVVKNDNEFLVNVEIDTIKYNKDTKAENDFSFEVLPGEEVKYSPGFDLSEIDIKNETTCLEHIAFGCSVINTEIQDEKSSYIISEVYEISIGEEPAIKLLSAGWKVKN